VAKIFNPTNPAKLLHNATFGVNIFYIYCANGVY